MSLAWRSEDHAAGVIGTTHNVGEPLNTAVGDVLVGCITSLSGGAIAGPAGWTVLYAGEVVSTVSWWVGYIVRTESAPSYIWSGFSDGVYRNLEVSCFSGAAASPIHASADVTTDVSASGPDPPSVTASVVDTLAIACGVKATGSPTWVAPTNYTIRGTNSNYSVMASRLLSGTGAENPSAFTSGGVGTVNRWAATILLHVPPVLAPVFPPTHRPFPFTPGSW